MIKKYGIYIFLFVLALHCTMTWTGQDTARTVTKLFLVPILMIYLYACLPARKHEISPAWPLTALFFSFLGDLFLTQSGQNYFLLGMGAFIITHVCNSIYFLKMKAGGGFFKSNPALIAAPVLASIVWLVYGIMKDDLGAFKMPILVYIGIICIMGELAVNMTPHKKYGKIGFRWFVPGAALFIISDAMLALDKFHFHDPPTWSVPVMLTYGLAQCFLVIGVSKQQNVVVL